MVTETTRQRDTFGSSLDQLNKDMYAADRALNEGNRDEAARLVERMRLTMNKYRGNAGDSQAAYNTFDTIIIPSLARKLENLK